MTKSTETTPTTTVNTDSTEPVRSRRRFVPIAIGAGVGLVVAAVLGGVAFAVADDAFDDEPQSVALTDQGGTHDSDDRNDSDDDSDQAAATPAPAPSATAISSADRDKASAAAIAAAGGGTVTDVDRSDDPGEAWEVEVLLDNGDEVEVELDAAFKVLRTELDPRDND